MRHLILASLFIPAALPIRAVEIGKNAICFVPEPDDCALVAVAEIQEAQHTLDVQPFQLTEPRIAQAILDAKNRGVAVRLLLDKKAPAERNGQTAMLTGAGNSGLGGLSTQHRPQQGHHRG